jgi:DNA-binding NtrC family response regulator
MIVSTDTDLTLLLQFLLETDEFQVTVSETRDSAMQALLIDPPEAIFFDLSFEDGKILNLLEFIQSAFPRIAIFTVVRPEQRAWAEKSLETTVQGCLSTPVDYRGVRTLLADAGSRKHRLTYRTSNPASLSVN